jgi:hypothetical protein
MVCTLVAMPIPLVGHYPNVVYIYNDSAMKNLYRMNVGGEQIVPKYDTGMFRNWDIDDGSIFGADAGIKPFDKTMKVLCNNHVPAYTAPSDVYRTSRSMASYEKGLVNLNYNQTWLNPSEPKGSLATMHRVAKVKNSKKLTFILIGCGFGALAILIILCLPKLIVIRPRKFMPCCVLSPNQIEKAKKSLSFCCQFSLKEIKVATNDFNEALILGTAGFGSIFFGTGSHTPRP